MAKELKCVVLEADNAYHLTQHIKDHIATGYRPLGPASVAMAVGNACVKVFTITMVKEAKDAKDTKD